MTNYDIRQLQQKILGNLLSIHQVCEEHGLRYYLWAGTMLGAIRHKGFIPWDDDIDVFVTRETYECLQNNFNKWGKKKNLKLINYFSHGYYSTFAKIIDTRTKAVEEKRNEKIGLWIDLFIVDSMKQNDEGFSKPIIPFLKEIRYFGSEEYFLPNDSLKNALGNLKKWFVRFYKKPIYRKKIEKFIHENFGDYNVAYSFADQISWWESINNLDFDNLKEIEFEGNMFKIINNWEEYLVHRYGDDYMIPPPIDKRVNHALIKCEWKK